MLGYRSDDLITRIERDILDEISATSTPFDSTAVLEIASDLLQDTCAPMLTDTFGEYYVQSEDTTTTAGTASYDIPAAASFARLRDVTLVLSDGSTKNLVETSYADIESGNRQTQQGEPRMYYLQNNKIVLSAAPDKAYTLRISYFRRPERLVLAASAATVVSGSLGGYVITGGNNLSATTVNIQKATPHFDVLNYQVATDTLTDTAISLQESTTGSASAGDYITDTGYVVIPELPAELHPWLARLTASEILEARGDGEGSMRLFARAEKQLEKFMSQLQRRNTGETKVVVNRYGPFKRTVRWG